MSVSCRRGAIFQKFNVFLLYACLNRFVKDFRWFGDSFWEPKSLQHGLKKRLKYLRKFGSLLEGLGRAKRSLDDPRHLRSGSTGRGTREG